MRLISRLHSITRWPADSRRRSQLAQTDVEFCKALAKILFPEMAGTVPQELAGIWHAAQRILNDEAEP